MSKEKKNNPVRIDEESMRWARIAASYKGLNLSEYVSATLLRAAKEDVEREHAAISAAEVETAKPRKPKGSD